MELQLQPLNDDESVELVLYHTKREVNKHDFGMESELQFTVKHMM